MHKFFFLSQAFCRSIPNLMSDMFNNEDKQRKEGWIVTKEHCDTKNSFEPQDSVSQMAIAKAFNAFYHAESATADDVYAFVDFSVEVFHNEEIKDPHVYEASKLIESKVRLLKKFCETNRHLNPAVSLLNSVLKAGRKHKIFGSKFVFPFNEVAHKIVSSLDPMEAEAVRSLLNGLVSLDQVREFDPVITLLQSKNTPIDSKAAESLQSLRNMIVLAKSLPVNHFMNCPVNLQLVIDSLTTSLLAFIYDQGVYQWLDSNIIQDNFNFWDYFFVTEYLPYELCLFVDKTNIKDYLKYTLTMLAEEVKGGLTAVVTRHIVQCAKKINLEVSSLLPEQDLDSNERGCITDTFPFHLKIIKLFVQAKSDAPKIRSKNASSSDVVDSKSTPSREFIPCIIWLRRQAYPRPGYWITELTASH